MSLALDLGLNTNLRTISIIGTAVYLALSIALVLTKVKALAIA